MRVFFASLMLISVVAVQGTVFQSTLSQPAGTTPSPANPGGRWRVKFALSGIGEKNLIIESQTKGAGSFLLLDAGPDDKTVPTPLPAAWSQTTNDRVSFSGEVELPFGTCCRETGTLILKGKFSSSNSISGKAIFITSTTDEENFNGFRSAFGTFTATREPNNQ
jgi:hypothetical protein